MQKFWLLVSGARRTALKCSCMSTRRIVCSFKLFGNSNALLEILEAFRHASLTNSQTSALFLKHVFLCNLFKIFFVTVYCDMTLTDIFLSIC